MTQFLTTPVDKSLGTTGTWQDIDLSGDVPIDATGAIFRVVNGGSIDRSYGLRKNGSTDDRYEDLRGYKQQYAIIGLDANRKCEGKIEGTYLDFFLIGYTEEDATFFTNASDKSIATLTTWTDIDLSSDIAVGSVAAIFEVVNGSISYQNFGLRKNGSTDNRHTDAFGHHHSFIIVGVDANRKCEGYIETSDVDFYLLGYLTMGQAETNAINKSLGSTGSYVDIDESANAPSGATGIFGELSSTDAYKYATRKNGTSFDYYEDCQLHDSLMAGVDANKKWEGKIESTNVDFFTLGYFVTPAVAKPRSHGYIFG